MRTPLTYFYAPKGNESPFNITTPSLNTYLIKIDIPNTYLLVLASTKFI